MKRSKTETNGHFKIRNAKVEDLDQIMEVLKSANFHRIPSEEMPDLDLRYYYVAECDGAIVGVCGYKLLGPGEGKTTLVSVKPSMRDSGIGMALQKVRLEAMYRAGVRHVTTNADLPETIQWYQRHFGYRKVGTLAKIHEFGDPAIDHWTTLRMDLRAWWKKEQKMI
jgi:ribosomal-protein-alanine N-acetyltransferase